MSRNASRNLRIVASVVVCIAMVALATGAAQGAIITVTKVSDGSTLDLNYFDAVPTNTALVGTTGVAWTNRGAGTFGLNNADGIVDTTAPLYYEASGNAGAQDTKTLKTTVSGLTPGQTYDFYVHFWGKNSAGEDWPIRAGLAQDSMALYAGAVRNLAIKSALGGGVYTSIAAEYSHNNKGGTPALLERVALIGSGVATQAGTFEIFIDDVPANSLNTPLRTWYDGVSFAAVPEPATMGLLALGGIALLRRRQRSGSH